MSHSAWHAGAETTSTLTSGGVGKTRSARSYWARRCAMVSVLDGGFNRWVEEGRPVEEGPSRAEPRTFTPRPRERIWVTAAELLAMLDGPSQILDARDRGQFTGARRRGPRGGHVPGAINLPRELFFAEGGGFLAPEEVRTRIADLGIDPRRPVVTYCNGGVAATVIAFQLHRLGFEDVAVYDGSWNEWGERLDLRVEHAAVHEEAVSEDEGGTGAAGVLEIDALVVDFGDGHGGAF